MSHHGLALKFSKINLPTPGKILARYFFQIAQSVQKLWQNIGLENLTSLNLSSNTIKSDESGLKESLSRLKQINLSENNINAGFDLNSISNNIKI